MRVTVNGTAYEVEVDVVEDREGVMHGPHAPQTISLNPQASRQKVAASAAPAKPVIPAASPSPAAAADGPALTSPIPGTIIEVHAVVGQEVKLGDPVIVIDAMKMHTQITANQDGKVKAVLVKAGDAVQMGQALLTYE
jgi:pyruvate dehydrogenase E2 component (dihydrolipoamide acetyltransferase)